MRGRFRRLVNLRRRQTEDPPLPRRHVDRVSLSRRVVQPPSEVTDVAPHHVDATHDEEGRRQNAGDADHPRGDAAVERVGVVRVAGAQRNGTAAALRNRWKHTIQYKQLYGWPGPRGTAPLRLSGTAGNIQYNTNSCTGGRGPEERHRCGSQEPLETYNTIQTVVRVAGSQRNGTAAALRNRWKHTIQYKQLYGWPGPRGTAPLRLSGTAGNIQYKQLYYIRVLRENYSM